MKKEELYKYKNIYELNNLEFSMFIMIVNGIEKGRHYFSIDYFQKKLGCSKPTIIKHLKSLMNKQELVYRFRPNTKSYYLYYFVELKDSNIKELFEKIYKCH